MFEDFTNSNSELADRVSQAEEAYQEYVAADLAIALHFDNLRDLQEARDNGQVTNLEAYNTAAYQIDQAQDTEMLDPQEWEEYSDYVREAASAIDDFNSHMNEMEADIVAKSIMKMNQAIELLADNFDEWYDILNNDLTPASEEYADALINTRQAVAMLLDVSEDYVSSDFITGHLEDIQEAATGSETAIEELRTALSEDIMLNILIDNDIFGSQRRQFLDDFNNLVSEIPNITVGTTLTTGTFIDDLNALVEATGMTVDQVNALCDSMGFEANFAEEWVDTEQQSPRTITRSEVVGYTRGKAKGPGTGDEGQEWEMPIIATSTYTDGYDTYTGRMPVIAMTTDGSTPTVNAITRKPSAAHNNYSSSNGGGKSAGKSGGGGGSKSGSQKKPKDPTGEIERYHVINNQIEDNEKALTRLAKAKDRAYGRARLNAMDAEIAKQRESVELAERKLQEVEKYLELDSGAIAAFGAEFDVNGTIVNYDQLMQQQIDKYNAAVEAYNNSAMDENAEAVFQQA